MELVYFSSVWCEMVVMGMHMFIGMGKQSQTFSETKSMLT